MTLQDEIRAETNSTRECSKCHGEGVVETRDRNPDPMSPYHPTKLCVACGGTGLIPKA